MYVINEKTHVINEWADTPINHQRLTSGKYGVVRYSGEVEQGYDGLLYAKGYAPVKPVAEKEAEVRAIRNQYLADTDKYMIADFPITDEQREEYKAYRQYLRDYTKLDSWYEKVPITFEEFEATTEHASAKEVTEQIVTDEVDNGTV